MKKFLSLVLALVMTMSLVTVSAGAKDFTDSETITYVEAVDVMSAVGIIDGYNDGSFKPTATLTRGAAAKIICNLILGPTTADALATTTAPFSDVAADSTFAGYIAYLAKEGIIGGYADGTFKPGNSLTGYAFLKMLLGALGYDADIEGYNGANYSVSVAKQAIEAGLTKGLVKDFDGRPAVTREEACLYAFNTLKAIMVDYDNRIVIGEGSTAVAISGIRYDKNWDKGKLNDGNIKKDGFVQFAEQYFPNLTVETSNGTYGRPANTWKLKKVEIGTYTSIEPTIVYTENTKEKVVYSDLGKAVCDDYTWTAFVNGKEVKTAEIPVKNSTARYTYTNKGAVTEIYVDDDAESVTVVQINNYLGQVTKVKSDSDGEYITVSVLDSKVTLNDKTFYVEGYEEDDYVVFTVDYDEDDKAYVIGEVSDPEVVTGVVSRVEKEKNDETAYLRVDGDKISYSVWMVYDLDDTNKNEHPELEVEYNLYLDPNGYVLGYAEAEETVDQYLYVLDTDEEMNEWRAKVMLADGTKVTVDLEDEYEDFVGDDVKIQWKNSTKKDMSNVEGYIWRYSVDDDGVYTLKQAVTYTATTDIKNGKSYMEVEGVSGTDNVTEVIVDLQTTFVNMDDKVAYVGYKAVPDVDDAQIAYVKDGKDVKGSSDVWYNDGKIVEVAFILDGEYYDSASTYFVIADKDEYESAKYDGNNYRVYSEAYINGEKVDGGLYVKYSEGKLKQGVVYKIIKTIEDGAYVTKVEEVAVAPTAFETVNAVGDNAFWLTNSGTELKNKYDTNDETVYVVIEVDKDGDLSVSEGTITDLKADDASAYVAKKSDDNTAKLVFVYVPYDGGKGTTGSTGSTTTDLVVTVADGKITVTDSTPAAKLDEVTEAVVYQLTKMGYSDVEVQVASSSVYGVYAEKNSVSTYFDYAGPFAYSTT